MPLNFKSSGGEAAPAFELKAAGFTLPVIRLLNGNMEVVAEQIRAKVEQAPEFFHNTPVVIDLAAFQEGAGEVEFPLLVGLLRGYGMIPFGVRGGSKSQQAAAVAMDLAVLGDAYARSTKAPAAAGGPEAGRAAVPTFTLVTRPVRSGQLIYAAGGDLSVIAPVSSGAELQADGNIHVYGALRGRALAGVQGNLSCRIFCHDLQAELVAIGGHYKISENIDDAVRGRPVQIYLKDNALIIEKI